MAAVVEKGPSAPALESVDAVIARVTTAERSAETEAPEPEAEEEDEPAAASAETETEEPEAEEKPDPDKAAAAPLDDAAKLKNLTKATQALKRGDLEAAAKLAFGEDGAKAFRLDSKKWAEFRKAQTSADRKTREREGRIAEAEQRLSRYAGDLESTVKAREAYNNGDFDAAMKLAFGLESANDFYKAHRAKVEGRDPRVSKLEKELQAMREKEQRQAEEAHRAELTKAQQTQVEAYVTELGTEMESLDHEGIAAASRIKAFRRDVYSALDAEFRAGRISQADVLDVLGDVAEKVFEDGGWADVLASGKPSDHRGSKPARRGNRPRTLNSSKATEVATPARNRSKPDLDDVIAKYERPLREALDRS